MFRVVLLRSLVQDRLEEVEEEHVDGQQRNYPYHNDHNDLKIQEEEINRKLNLDDDATNFYHGRVPVLVFALASRTKLLLLALNLIRVPRKNYMIAVTETGSP